MSEKVLNRPLAAAGEQRGASSTQRFAARAASARHRPWRVLRWAAVAVLLAALGAWAVLDSSLLAVGTVRVLGAPSGEAAAIRDQAQVPLGRALARVDAAAVARRSLRPDLASVTVRRSWPRTVVIQVVPRVAVLAVASPTDPHGEVELWDRYGIAFATATRAPAGVPVLDTSRGRLTPLAVGSVAAVLQEIPADRRREVSKVAVSDAGLVTFRLRKLRVVWGDSSDSALKLRVLEALVPQAHSLIDVSAPRTPAVQ